MRAEPSYAPRALAPFAGPAVRAAGRATARQKTSAGASNHCRRSLCRGAIAISASLPTRGRRGARARQLPTRCHEISAFGHGPCMGVALGRKGGCAELPTELLALPAQASQAVAVATDCQVSLSGCTSNLPAQPSADRRGPEARGAESPVVARRALSAYSCPRESDIAPAAGRLDQRARVARAVGRESASRILA